MADAADAPATKPTFLSKLDTQAFLALAIVSLMAIVVLMLILLPVKLDQMVFGALLTMLGVVSACFKDVYQYYFGSSQSSANKDAVISTALGNATPPTTPGG